MNYVCLVGQVVSWETHVLECINDDQVDARQCGFLLRLRPSSDDDDVAFCTLMYMSDDIEAVKLEHAKYAVVIGTIVDAKPQLLIQTCTFQSFDEAPDNIDVMKFYADTMRELYTDPLYIK